MQNRASTKGSRLNTNSLWHAIRYHTPSWLLHVSQVAATIVEVPFFRPRRYWESRHLRNRGAMRATGHRFLGEQANQVDYVLKSQMLLRCVERLCGAGQERSLLDAGCGTGYFSRKFESLGFQVTGVDFAETAICQAQEQGQGTYRVADLSDLHLQQEFDVVVCIDVLFHVVDDHLWKKVLSSLTRHLKPSGRLVLQESLETCARRSCSHVRRRTRSDYDDALRQFGLHVVATETYRLPKEQAHKDILIAAPVSGS